MRAYSRIYTHRITTTTAGWITNTWARSYRSNDSQEGRVARQVGFSQQTIRDCAPDKAYKEVSTAAKGKGGRPTKATKQAKSLTPIQVSAEEQEAVEKMWA